MGGIVAACSRIRGDTLGAILLSMVISLTATPMMCAHLLKEQQAHGWFYRTSEKFFDWVVATYGRTLTPF